MDTPLKLETEVHEGILVVSVTGRIDTTSVDSFHSAVDRQLQDAEAGFVVDCSDLLYISSAGLRSILLHAKTASKRNVQFVLCCLPNTIKEIVRIAGFDRIITIRETRAQATAFIKAS
ncbi:MAG: STAS domain-containing protein [Pseudomonadales bacterium]|nr:STAS domain-containing protein [Pseudomonadales bacterium]